MPRRPLFSPALPAAPAKADNDDRRNRAQSGLVRQAGALLVCCVVQAMPQGPASAAATRRHADPHLAHASAPRPDTAVRAAATQSRAARNDAARAASVRDAARKAAQNASDRAMALSRQTVQAAAAVQRTEQAADDAQHRTEALEQQRAAAAAELETDSRALAPLLPVIERLSLYPAETLLAAPFSPADSLTALSVLRSIGSGLERRAEQTRDAARRLQALGSSLDAERSRLLALQGDQARQQQAAQDRADIARSAQAASARQFDQAARTAADAAARASTLDGVLAHIEAADRQAQQAAEHAARQAAAGSRPGRPPSRQDAIDPAGTAPPAGPGLATGSAGALVAGRLVQRFGDSIDGSAATGVRYAPPSRATVTAPCNGRIDFASAFRSYGQMLILDCGRGDRFVLAGFGSIDVGIGQAVARGAQLGHMPAWTDAGARSGLYVQLRHGDRSVDPLRALPH